MSIACVPSHRQWLAMRCSSARIVRMYRARGGTSSDISFSTVSTVAEVVAGRGDVVHPVGDEHDLRPVAVLAQLLDAAVQIADHDVAVDDALAVEPQHDPQHAVRARMLRPHVE